MFVFTGAFFDIKNIEYIQAYPNHACKKTVELSSRSSVNILSRMHDWLIGDLDFYFDYELYLVIYYSHALELSFRCGTTRTHGGDEFGDEVRKMETTNSLKNDFRRRVERTLQPH